MVTTNSPNNPNNLNNPHNPNNLHDYDGVVGGGDSFIINHSTTTSIRITGIGV
jgi:hypothetical protein